MQGPRIRPRVECEMRGRLGVLLGATRALAKGRAEERFTLDLLDLDAVEIVPTRIRLAFPGHGLAVNPGEPREAVVFEKRGVGGCAVDLAERRVTRSIEPMAGHAFYGHCAYSRTGDVLFVVETRLQSRAGAISIRDSATFAVLGTLPTYGIAPHDCHLIEGGGTLVVTNGGGPIDTPDPPSVTFVDVASRALLEKHELPVGHLNMGHVAVTEGREFAAVSAPREGLAAKRSLGGVTLRRRGERPVPMDAPAAVTSRLVGESLSVAIRSASRTVVATHPDANLVTFWSLDGDRLLTTLELAQPRGVTMTLDQRFFAFSYGVDGRLLIIEAERLRELTDRRLGAGILGGAHIYSWSG